MPAQLSDTRWAQRVAVTGAGGVRGIFEFTMSQRFASHGAPESGLCRCFAAALAVMCPRKLEPESEALKPLGSDAMHCSFR